MAHLSYIARSIVFMCLAMTHLPQAWSADNYPVKPIRAIVPFPAGQGADILMRVIADQLVVEFGQQVIVDNRPGAGGAVGTAIAAKASPDGYTLYMGSSGPLAISPNVYPNVGYDPVKDFAPISNIASVAQVLVTSPSSSIRSVKDFVEQAKARPGELQFASPGSGTTSQLTMELLAQMARIKLVHVPYKGSPPAQFDVIAGRIPIMFDAAPGVLGYIKSGKLRPVAVSLSRRISFLPDVPTISESGVNGFNTMGWIGLLAPTGTSTQIISRLQKAIVKILQSPEAKKRFDDLAFTPIGDTSEEFRKFIKAEVALWKRVVKVSGAKVD